MNESTGEWQPRSDEANRKIPGGDATSEPFEASENAGQEASDPGGEESAGDSSGSDADAKEDGRINDSPKAASVDDAPGPDDSEAAKSTNSDAINACQNSTNNNGNGDKPNFNSEEIDKSNSSEEEDFVAIELVDTIIDAPAVPPRQSLQEESPIRHQLEQQPLLPPPSRQQQQQQQPPHHPIKKLHHPLLSPLTKVSWRKLASAAASCDLLFNCKYSMRQVEQEVREEKGGAPARRASDDAAAAEDEEECEEFDRREMGLHCCSALDGAEEDRRQRREREQGPSYALEEEERAKKSWKGVNPSLDMMLYKQFLDE